MKLALLVSLTFLALVGCGQMMTTDAGVDAGSSVTGNAMNGMTLYAARSCNGCHGATGEGNTTGPNISGSTTAGIGSWTLANFSTAVKEAKSPTGKTYCSTMTPFPTLTEQQLADLFAFLIAQKHDTPQRGTACP